MTSKCRDPGEGGREGGFHGASFTLEGSGGFREGGVFFLEMATLMLGLGRCEDCRGRRGDTGRVPPRVEGGVSAKPAAAQRGPEVQSVLTSLSRSA